MGIIIRFVPILTPKKTKMFNKSKKEKQSKIAKIAKVEKLNKTELSNVIGGGGNIATATTTQVSSINYNASKSNTGN